MGREAGFQYARSTEGFGAAGPELTCDEHALVGQQGFARNARGGFKPQELIEHRIGDRDVGSDDRQLFLDLLLK